jgi:hypothetical protein
MVKGKVKVALIYIQLNPCCTYILLHVLADSLRIQGLLPRLDVLSSNGLLRLLLGCVSGCHGFWNESVESTCVLTSRAA